MSRRGAVLLVEDDRDEVAVALRALERADLQVEVSVARDGVEALEVLGLEAGESAPQPPRVVFLDLKMPRVDGWEVLRRMHDDPRTRELPVIILSWSDQKQDVRRCYELGANSFLVKRFTPTNPGAYFAQAVRYWVELNQPPPTETPL